MTNSSGKYVALGRASRRPRVKQGPGRPQVSRKPYRKEPVVGRGGFEAAPKRTTSPRSADCAEGRSSAFGRRAALKWIQVEVRIRAPQFTPQARRLGCDSAVAESN
ncbi:hypothetical protein AOLI_G00027350 [Acnodon oligacanthus]